MKKKFLAIYALTGALVASPVFTSCVDDNESASVTAIRNAKAEQLKAVAALTNAKAEAELIAANADKALKEAQAEYQKALANATAADVERENQEFAARLEAIKAQAERDMWKAKLDAADFEQQFNDLADARVKELYDGYKDAIDILEDLLRNKITYNNTLGQLKVGAINAQEWADLTKEQLEKEIAKLEYEIGLYEKYEGADKTKLEQELMEANKQLAVLQEGWGDAQNALDKAQNAWSDFDDRQFDADTYNYTSPLLTVQAANKFLRPYDNNFNWINNSQDAIKKETKYLIEGSYEYSIPYYTLNADRINAIRTVQETEINGIKDELGVPATDATETTEAVEATGLYKELADNQKIVTVYEKEVAEGKAEADMTYNQWDYNNAKDRIEYLTIRIAGLEADLAMNEGYLADFEAAVKAFDAESEAWKAYEAAIAEATKLAQAVVDAQAAYDKVNDPIKEKRAEISALENKIDSAFDADSYINYLKQQILSKKEDIQISLNNVSNQEAAIARQEEMLKAVESQIEAQKAIIANIEEAIKAAIGEEEA